MCCSFFICFVCVVPSSFASTIPRMRGWMMFGIIQLQGGVGFRTFLNLLMIDGWIV